MVPHRNFELIVITEPTERAGEAAIISKVLDYGASLVYLRKEGLSQEKLTGLAEAIGEKHQSKIILPWQLVQRVALVPGAVAHIRSIERDAVSAGSLTKNLRYSTSVHNPGEIHRYSKYFSYIFFSPVFESISKAGYKPGLNLDQIRQLVQEYQASKPESSARLIALGGINEVTVRETREMGFDGAAVLGAVWNCADPVAAFLRIKAAAGI